jgi:HEPN domain-containing protein
LLSLPAAAEKILKVYLISRGIAFAKTHNLEFLLEMCIKEDADFKNVDVSNLTYYAVEVRYPDDFYIPDQKEAEESYNVAADIMKFVLKKMKPKK